MDILLEYGNDVKMVFKHIVHKVSVSVIRLYKCTLDYDAGTGCRSYKLVFHILSRFSMSS